MPQCACIYRKRLPSCTLPPSRPSLFLLLERCRERYAHHHAERIARRLSYEKKTPFCSFPSTETRFRAGSGVSDSKWKPGSSADHLIVAPVLRNEPLKVCAGLS